MRILLVEDRAPDRALVRAALQEDRAGDAAVSVDEATTLTGALEMLGDGAYDAVVLDLALPDSWGFETVGRVREAVPEVALVVLTGRDDDGVEEGVLRAGADAYLSKDVLIDGGTGLLAAISVSARDRQGPGGDAGRPPR